MITRKQFEKWGGVALAGLCVFLIFRLVSEIMGSPTPDADTESAVSMAAPSPAPQAMNSQKKGTAPAKPASTLQVQALDEFEPKPLPDISRNPFDFGAPPLTPAQRAMQAARGPGGAMTASSAPPPPQIPLRAIGYSERPGSKAEAYLTDAENVYIVHDGDVLEKRYRILKITPSIVEVQDGTSGEKAQLPIPEVE
jgi:hypothetical protein